MTTPNQTHGEACADRTTTPAAAHVARFVMRTRQLLAALAAVVALSLAAVPAGAAQLVMFEDIGCYWCHRWHETIGPAYPKTAEGQLAPLRQLMRRDRLPADIKLKSPVIMSPTFVLVDDRGREVDRITGYPPPEFFWGMLNEMLAKLPPAPEAADGLRRTSLPAPRPASGARSF